MNNQDRIRLAEFVGWRQEEHFGTNRFIKPGHNGIEGFIELPFDPFTNANDDYAVLEFMRANPSQFVSAECEVECQGWAWKYHIGDYARACLKVLP